VPTDPFVIIVVLFGAALGGCASGLAGFAFSATTLGIYAHVLAPSALSPVVVAASLTVQLMVMPALWHRLDWKTATPFLIGGLLGVPFGVALLEVLTPGTFRLIAGIVLVIYAVSVMTAKTLPAINIESRTADGGIGFCGGVLGGFAGLSGMVPTIWCSLRRWPKDRQRSVFQLFNTAMHIITLTGYGLTGRLTLEVGAILLLAVPALALGGWAGFKLYNRVDDKAFSRVLLGLLGLSGITLVAPHLLALLG